MKLKIAIFTLGLFFFGATAHAQLPAGCADALNDIDLALTGGIAGIQANLDIIATIAAEEGDEAKSDAATTSVPGAKDVTDAIGILAAAIAEDKAALIAEVATLKVALDAVCE